MARSYRSITPEVSRRIRLIMADVDGTLNTGGDDVSPRVRDVIKGLQDRGIMLGLVSGRTDPLLVKMAGMLNIGGPLIGENGAVARLSPDSGLVDLGYSRRPALEALEQLKARYPGRVREREDNSERLIDVVFWADGITSEELKQGLQDVQLLDSTYILHLMSKGIDKGKTLLRLLGQIDGGKIRADEVLVAGDSMTDLSLFKLFPISVLIPNPHIPAADRKILLKAAAYKSDHEAGEGFVEVAAHIINVRT
ncbi:MAG: HAD hydrolase family protein [Chloroflexi bacterium]|nr:HAD hydrolase family protein [Chloroflexota bacterium]